MCGNANTKDTISLVYNMLTSVSVATLLVAMAKLMMRIVIQDVLEIRPGHVVLSGITLCILPVRYCNKNSHNTIKTSV